MKIRNLFSYTAAGSSPAAASARLWAMPARFEEWWGHGASGANLGGLRAGIAVAYAAALSVGV